MFISREEWKAFTSKLQKQENQIEELQKQAVVFCKDTKRYIPKYAAKKVYENFYSKKDFLPKVGCEVFVEDHKIDRIESDIDSSIVEFVRLIEKKDTK